MIETPQQQQPLAEPPSGPNYTFLIPILMGVTLAIGLWLGTMFIPSSGSGSMITETSNKYNTVLQMIEDNYVDTVDNQLLIESSIQW